MDSTPRPRVKVCCIADVGEVRAAVAAGASALGLVSTMPSGPGVISDEQIAAVTATVPPPVATFLLTCRQDAGGIAEQIRRAGVNTVQICDALTGGTYAELRAALPGVKLVQVIHVRDPGSVDEAVAVAPHVDALLLDSGNPAAAVKELGGTGRVHDWAVSRRIREAAAVPVFLAGGLTPANVARAVAEVGPFGLDVCSGVRTDGRLDAVKLGEFMRQAGA